MEFVADSADGQVSVIYTTPSPNANTASASVTCDTPSGTPLGVGTHIITCTITDAFGNEDTCNFTVIIYAPPDISCPEDMTFVADSADGQVSVIYTTPSPNANTANASVTCDTPSGTPLAVGTHVITCTITDAFGNEDNCNFTVIVCPPPEISCPDDIEFVADAADGQVYVTYTPPTPSQDKPGTKVTCDIPSGTLLGVGTYTITCVITDAFGNEDTCSFTVIVYAPPDISCPEDMEFVADSADGQVSVIYTTPSPNANTANASVTCDTPSGTPLGVGTHIITCTITDVFGNEDTCNFTVIVYAPPDISCPEDMEFVADSADGQVSVIYTTPSPNANTANASVTCDTPSGTPLGVGTHIITCTITDVFGNEDTCNFTVTIYAPPDVTCPSDLTFIDYDGDGKVVVTYTLPPPNQGVTCDFPSGTTFYIGTHTITCSVTDVFGNNDTCEFTVKIVKGMYKVEVPCRKYYFFLSEKPYHFARYYCESKMAHLATIPNQAVNEMLVEYIESSTKRKKFCYWFGAKYSDPDNKWKYIGDSGICYDNWGPGQPDRQGCKDCGLFWSGNWGSKRMWKAAECKNKNAFICEKP
ncbi:hyalin-like [Ptychodera flava]|uniref:hyalin-like n=1 Tax=Ptychodera flava TaxID=63121 RepID=UPI00396A77F7